MFQPFFHHTFAFVLAVVVVPALALPVLLFVIP
jgi:hypothetical protein